MSIVKTQVNINGIDVTSYLVNYEIEHIYGDQIAQGDIVLTRGISAVLSINPGQTVSIYRGFTLPTDLKVFEGFIESFSPEGALIKVTAKDKLWDLVRKEVTHTYDSSIDASAGKISEIFKDLVTTYGLLNADGTSIQDSGTTLLISKFVCNHTDIFDRCKALATALDWQFYYRADTDKVYFEPKGFTSNSYALNVGTNVIGLPKWNYDNTEMVNDLTVVGAFQEIETTESGRIGVTTGYTTTEVSLSFTPISVKVYNDNSNPPTTLKVGGLPDSTTVFDYYVDKENKKIIPAPTTTFASNSYMEIRYSHAVPIPIHMYNQSSITLYGQFKKTVTLQDLRDVSDAEIRGTEYLARYSTPFVYTTLKSKIDSSANLAVGQLINVVDNISSPNVNKTLVINRHRIRYPGDYDEIDVGDKYWRLGEWQANVNESLKRLQEDELANQDLVTELISIDTTQTPVGIPTPRYFEILTQTVDGATLIWDHPTQGQWASSLVHYYQFNETSGTTATDIGITPVNLATINGNQNSGGILHYGYAPNGDNINTGYKLSSISTVTAAFSFWIKRTGTWNNLAALFSNRPTFGAGNGTIRFRDINDGNGNTLAFDVQDSVGINTISDTSPVSTSNFDFYVMNLDKGAFSVYRNGSQVGTTTNLTSFNFSGGSNNFILFAQVIGVNLISNIIFDEFRIYNELLTPAQITSLYNSGAGSELGQQKAYNWGGDAFGAETINYMRQYGNHYVEGFIDIDFEDVANTTASWTGAGNPLLTGLVAYYTLDSDASSSTGSHNGTLVNSPTFSSGVINNAINLNSGSSQYVNILNSSSFNFTDFSYNLWIKTSQTDAALISRGDGGFPLADLYLQSSDMTFYLYNSLSNEVTVSTSGGAGVSDNLWHMVTLVHSGNNWDLYRDGLNIATNTTTAQMGVDFYLMSTDYFIGHDNYGGRAYNGLIDETGIWNRALVLGEITELYNSGHGKAYPFLSGLTFASPGQQAQSSSIDYNNGQITYATLNASVSSGAYNYYLTADGGAHWESVTNGSEHIFTYPGTDLRFKIVATSAGVIPSLGITKYHPLMFSAL